MKINWRKKAREYIEVLQLEEYPRIFWTQKQAKSFIMNWIDFVIGTNGKEYLWDCEKELIKLLNI